MSAIPPTTPLLLMGGGAVLVYLLARLVTRHNAWLALATALVLGAALAVTAPLVLQAARGDLATWPTADGAAMLRGEPGGLLAAITALALGLGVALYSGAYLALDQRPDRFYPLLLLMVGGAVGMTLAVDLFTLYLLTMLTSATSYVLVAFRRGTETAIEAGFKYAITGSMGSIMMLAGIGLVFRSTGALALPLGRAATDGWHLLGIALITFGFVVKAALFPAHIWLPDAHGRAPSSVSALLSGIIVPIQLLTLVRVGLALGAPHRAFGWMLAGLGCGSMVTGNVMALRQTYGKRLLGYSTVAQMGYMALALGLGVALEAPRLIAAALLLLVAHALLKSLAFMAKGMLHFYCNATEIADLNGLARRAPFAAGALGAMLLGLAGVPPLAGFVAKFSVLQGLAGLSLSVALAAAAVYLVNSLVSLGYYVPLVGRLLGSEPAGSSVGKLAPRPSTWMWAPIVALGLVALLLGVWPAPVWRLAEQAAHNMLTWGR
jgi:proton-translocating NADH-quinone oxidoreductase chain N